MRGNKIITTAVTGYDESSSSERKSLIKPSKQSA
jgi:hypothetical protein